MRPFLALAAFLWIAPFALAQDDADKATRILLDKAEDEYRTYFKRPETTYQLWAAIKFEVDTGKFDLGAFHLKRLLNKEKVKADQVDEDLFKIETVEGMNSFLRLMRVVRWSEHAAFQKEAEANVKQFFDRLNAVVEKKLSDPDRINKYIKQLDADTVEERTYAFTQLNRSRERAVPLLVEKLQESMSRPLHQRIIETMVNLDPDTVPAYLEVLKARDEKDASNQELRLTLLRILRKRGDERVLPYLWHLSASKMYPPLIRETALNFLAEYLKVDKEILPPAKLALLEQSDKYFKHKVKFPDRIRLWRWDGQKISTEPVEIKAADAEELFGIRYALEALDLDPAYTPAQLAFLAMTLERTILQEFDQAILKPLPNAAQRLFATLDADLILRLQERAYEENNIPIILGTIRALGDRGETRAAKPSAFGTPQGVVRGLYYPDRRVQFQAINALLKMPTDQSPAAAGRTVEALTRLVTVDQPPAALVVGAALDKADRLVADVKEAGFVPVLVKSIPDALARARTMGNVDVIFLHYGMSPREIPFALTQLRKDVDVGAMPIVIVTPTGEVEAYQKFAARYRSVRAVPESLFASADEVKKTVDDLTAGAAVAKLTADERKAITSRSLDILHQMARGQIIGYDVRPSLDNVASTLRSPDYTPIALEILGRLPGTVAQMRIADVILDPSREKARIAAAQQLNRHAQYNGLLMPKNQVEGIKSIYYDKATDVGLRTELAYFIGSFRTSPTRDGVQIFQYRPDPPVAPAAPMEKKE